MIELFGLLVWFLVVMLMGQLTGNTRRYGSSLEKITKVIEPRSGEIMFGLKYDC